MVVFYVLGLINILTCLCLIGFVSSAQSLVKEWKCVNPDCNVPISEGETGFTYSSPDHELKLTFKAKDQVEVLRKPADNEREQGLWWISLNGREGYVSKEFIKENKILNKKLINVRKIENQKSISISPSPTFEISDGTTILPEYAAEDGVQFKYDTIEGPVGTENVPDQTESKEEKYLTHISDKPGVILNESVNSTISVLSKSGVDVDNNDSSYVEVVEDKNLKIEISKLDISVERKGNRDEKIGEAENSNLIVEKTDDVKIQALTENDKNAEFGKFHKPDEVDKLGVRNVEDDTSLSKVIELDQPIAFEIEDDKLSIIEDNRSTNREDELDESIQIDVQNDKYSKLEKNMRSTFKYKLKNVNENLVLQSNVKKQHINQNNVNDDISKDLLGRSINFSAENNLLLPEDKNSTNAILETAENVTSNLQPQKHDSESESFVAKEKIIIKDSEKSSTVKNMDFIQSASLGVNKNMEEVKKESLILNQVSNNYTSDVLDSSSSLRVERNFLENNTSVDQEINVKSENNHGVPLQTRSNSEQSVISRTDYGKDNSLLVDKSSSEFIFKNAISTGNRNDDFNVNDQGSGPLIEETGTVGIVTGPAEDSGPLHSDGGQLGVAGEQPVEAINDISKPSLSESTATSHLPDGEINSVINNSTSLSQDATDLSKMSTTESVITSEFQYEHSDHVQVKSTSKSDDDVKGEATFSEPEPSSRIPRHIGESNEESQRKILNGENFQDTSQKWFSTFQSVMESLQGLYLSSLAVSTISEPASTSEVITEVQEIPEKEFGHEKTAESSNEFCRLEQNVESLIEVQDTSDPSCIFEGDNFREEGRENFWCLKSVLWLAGTSLVVLCFSLGYYYLDNIRRDGELVQKNNALASELFVLEREKSILEEDLATLREKEQKLIEEKNVLEDQLYVTKETLQKTKEEKINIEEKETKLIKKLMMVEQNYNELRKIFSESKLKAERAALISDIKKLKESIAADSIEISSLKEDLQEKKNEIKSLSSSLQKSQEAKIALEEQIEKMAIEGQEIAREYQVTLTKMEQTVEENKLVQSKIEDDLRKQKKECESLKIQKELAETALQKAHGITSTESLADWFEIKEVRISLFVAEKEIRKITQDRENLLESLDLAKEKCNSLAKEVEQLSGKYEDAEKEKVDALTKLQVLSNYFKEKEVQLQEELGMKEAQWLQKQSDDSTIYQQMRDLREENINLKSLLETLKKEILDQEAAYKKIIYTTEQKAHENWVCYRRAEMRLKEVQAEAAQLRNKLTTLETCDESQEDKSKSGGLEVNGDLAGLGSAMSPPFMLYPNEFIPPPPLLPSTAGGNTASRPPPLGRISSPPLVSGDFIPPPPLLPPYEVFHHGHISPPSPPPPLLHKPQPREHQITQPSSTSKQKDSQSSNHSSESLHDKTPARKGKR
ncbi:uncharacterized protein isoform X2 [Rhodnius prolixus]